MYYVWNLEREMWWNQNQFGYTSDIEQAGKFSLEEAEEISKQANILGYINDKMVEESDLDQVLEVQQMSGKEKKRDLKEVLGFYNIVYHKTNPMGDIISDLKTAEYYPEEVNIDHLEYEKSHRYNLRIENERDSNVVVNLYRMASGNYEVNTYISPAAVQKRRPKSP